MVFIFLVAIPKRGNTTTYKHCHLLLVRFIRHKTEAYQLFRRTTAFLSG